MSVVSPNMSQCARCGEPCEANDLVCNRCSETRIRATLPASDAPPEEQSEARLVERLEKIEQLAGEKAYRLAVAIDGSLGGESTLVLSVVTAANGPATPAEDVWAEPAVLATFECATQEAVSARLTTAQRLTRDRDLQSLEVSRRLRVGTRGFMGEASAAGMLLDARLHMARLALESYRALGAHLEYAGGTVRVLVDFTNKAQADEQMTVELFSEAAASPALRESLEAWVISRRELEGRALEQDPSA